MLHIFKQKSLQHGSHLSEPVSVGKKRHLEEEDCEMECGESKRHCPPSSNGSSSNAVNGNLDKILNFPLPSSETVGCIVKMYKEDELPLNEVMEVVGILSFGTPGIQCADEEKEDFQPPSSVVPRIHCLVSRKWHHNNPCLSTHIGPKWEEGCVAIN